MDEQLFTRTQVDLALRKEKLILRVERGESLETASQELGRMYHPKHVSRLRRQYLEGGRHWTSLVDGRERRPSPKITEEIEQWIVEELRRDPNVTVPDLRDHSARLQGGGHGEAGAPSGSCPGAPRTERSSASDESARGHLDQADDH